ncbi:MAG: outer membrane protein/protective antigen [Acidobacteria bacterium]|jgi:hypothetical protein|nr:outer membrane protein/protective antigen [Acidobacteriota bacterium]
MIRFVIGRRAAGRASLALALTWAATLGVAQVASAQAPAEGEDTRAGRIAVQQQAKSGELKPYEPNKAEIWVKKLEEQFLTGALKWHPFFDSAYAGGGFTLGAGYLTHVSDYNTLDVRGSITFTGYKRLEAEFLAPRLFGRRGTLSVIGGWREATQVGFYGFGTGNTSKDDRANYSFTQPYGAATLEVWPTRKWLVLVGGVDYSQWDVGEGGGSAPSVEEVYTPETLPGLGAKVTYLHALGTAAFDWRESPGYTRRGGHYGVTFHEYSDTDDTYSFRQVDYEAIQHIPLFREAWVLSLHGRVQTTYADDDQVIPFFMLPSLGGGSSLRGFTSWRFRDRHSLLLQAEWRVLVNSFFDTALFYDAGKVTDSRSDLDLEDLKSDYGIGFRLHGPAATPLRVELAKSNEGLVLVFSAKASF